MPGDDVFWYCRSDHRPPHRYVGGMAHMVTGATIHHAGFLGPPRRKARWLQLVRELCVEMGIEVMAWVCLDNHYHGVTVPDEARALPRMIGRLHSITATEFNREDNAPGRQVWYAHWDTTLYTEGDICSRINYIHRNPVKHGYVADPGGWAWSSYRAFIELEDPQLAEQLARFPAPLKLPGDRFTPPGQGAVR